MAGYHAHRPHPWHGLDPGPQPPSTVSAYIELTPFDLVKYEADKATGYLRVDRPQRTSSTPPTLYGFIPRTLCGAGVAALSAQAREADGDPLDICVLSERPINRVDIVLDAMVVGGLGMLDGGLADDKIIAILRHDPVWGEVREVSDLPKNFVERLQHYFSTYKLRVGQAPTTSVGAPYGASHAHKVVTAAIEDYRRAYPH